MTEDPPEAIPVEDGSSRQVLALLPAMLAVALLFGGALVGAVRISLEPNPFGSPNLGAWRALVEDPLFWDAALFSARLGLVATGVAAVLALVAAALVRTQGRLLQGLFSLPVLMPHLVAAVMLVLWAGPGGIVERFLGAMPIQLLRDQTGLGIILVYIYKEVPFLVLLVLAAWGPEVTSREEAAALVGAGPWFRFRWVVWPAIRRPVLVGSLIVAAFVFGSFEVPLVVGPSHPVTLPVLALEATRTAEIAGQARAAAILLVTAAVSITFAVVAAHWARRTEA